MIGLTPERLTFPLSEDPTMRRLSASLALLLTLTLLTVAARGEVKVKPSDDGRVEVTINGKPFTTYHVKSGAKPVLWPVYGPTGKEMTRGYPMREPTAKEKKDHIHHRSLWFTHGDVNGVSFWHEQGANGEIIHQKFLNLSSGKQGVIASQNDWIGPDGKKICEDYRSFVFSGDDKSRQIDVEITVKASEGEVKFGDTKEGCFGVRVAGSMRTELNEGGQILTSEGKRDKAAWGTKAPWVDYSGPVDGETLGVAILNHPSSFRYPTYWHVRTYGLFAANPFGLHNFLGKEHDGSHTMKKGETFTLRYRVLLHAGDAETADVASAFEKYSKWQPKK